MRVRSGHRAVSARATPVRGNAPLGGSRSSSRRACSRNRRDVRRRVVERDVGQAHRWARAETRRPHPVVDQWSAKWHAEDAQRPQHFRVATYPRPVPEIQEGLSSQHVLGNTQQENQDRQDGGLQSHTVLPFRQWISGTTSHLSVRRNTPDRACVYSIGRSVAKRDCTFTGSPSPHRMGTLRPVFSILEPES